MMKKDYIIWGISDTGYKEAISSSFENNALPSKFKAAVSDKHRTIANYFSQENSDNDYFYSIESLDNEVLYTIYRTNWYRGSRLSFDAATIIVNKNQIIEKSLHSLKLLITSYITQKESGVGEFNFENVISQIKLRAKQSNERRSISRKYKEGYIKYQSEADLNSIFSDIKNQLHNFNKVFFFTRLTYLEEGASKLQNLDNYKEIPIRLINYDERYYRVLVEENVVNIFGNTFNAYVGDEIKIYKSTGNTPQKVEVAKAGLSIKLNKITPPKPPRSRGSQNKKNKKNKEKYAIIGLCSLVVLVILGFVYMDNILNAFKGPDKTKPTIKNHACKIELVESTFINNGKEITDPSELLECFKDGHIKVDNIKYKLTDSRIQNWKHDQFLDIKIKNIKELYILKKNLQENDKNSVSKEVVNEIEKRINLLNLESESGLKGNNYTWQWKVKDKKPVLLLLLLHKDSTDFIEAKQFIKVVKNVENLLDFLKTKKPIPTSVLEDIKEYIKENGSAEVRLHLKKLKEDKRIEDEKKEKNDSIDDINPNEADLKEENKKQKNQENQENQEDSKEEEKKKAEEKEKAEEKKKAEEKEKTCASSHDFSKINFSGQLTIIKRLDKKIEDAKNSGGVDEEQVESWEKEKNEMCKELEGIRKKINDMCICEEKMGKINYLNAQSKCN
jgi:hypothetical protein